jgi:signal transduction histidine kinase
MIASFGLTECCRKPHLCERFISKALQRRRQLGYRCAAPYLRELRRSNAGHPLEFGCRKSPNARQPLSRNAQPRTSASLPSPRFVMRQRILHLVSPLHCMAYLTWTTCLVGLLLGGTDPRDEVAPISKIGIVLVMLVYLAGFLYDAWRPASTRDARRTLIAFVIQAGSTLLLVALTRNGTAPALLIILVAQLVDLPKPLRVLTIALINIGLFAILSSIWTLKSAVIVTGMYFGFQMFAALTRHYAKEATEARDESLQVNAHLLATYALLEESARDGERLRLARELHDVAGHKLTALKLQLALLARDPARAPPAVISAAALADELLGDIRGVVSQMRAQDGLDLRRALEGLTAHLPRPRVHLDLAEDARVADIAQARALLRVAQEGLTNAARHSSAENVWLRLSREPKRLVLDVRDDGTGAKSLVLGNGLSGMCERLDEVGGGIDFTTGKGFRIQAWVPLT